ncbi:NADH-quinone oxidoreductase subunit J [Tautonia plasticadhaerens]|nr:NADH-quinone oxidoreductase subunit J [Tautonia plasticadhaerens]
MQLIFLIVSAVGLLTALGTVLAKNLVHAALFLVAFFFAVAAQFVLLEAEFLAAMQVLVYIGAVSILLLFGIMLTRNIQGDETTGGHWARKIPVAVVALGVLGVLLYGISAERGRPGQQSWARTVSRPGGVNPPVGGPGAADLSYSPSGRFVASIDLDGRVRLRTPVGRQVASFPTDEAAGRPTAVGFSVDGAIVASADDRGGVLSWDVARRLPAFSRSGGRPGRISALAVGPERPVEEGGRLVAAGGADGIVRLWDGPEPVEIPAHDGPIRALAFAPDGRLVSLGADRRARVLDPSTGEFASSVPAAPPGRPIAASAVGLTPAPRPVQGAGTPVGMAGPGMPASAPAPPRPPAEGLGPDLPPGPLAAVASLISGKPGRWDLRVFDATDGTEVLAAEDLEGVPIAVALGTGIGRVAALVGPASMAEADPGPAAGDAPVDASLLVWGFGPRADDGPPLRGSTRVTPGRAVRLGAGAENMPLVLAPAGGPVTFLDLDAGAAATVPATTASVAASAVADMPRAVGDELMTRFVVPFEVAGLLLTAALVGAIVLARQDDGAGPSPIGGEADETDTPAERIAR